MTNKQIGLLAISLIFLISVAISFGHTAQAKNLRVWGRTNQLEEVVNRFNEEMKKAGRDVKATYTLVPWGQQSEKFMSALAAQNAPDVYSFGIARIGRFLPMGAFRDITERAKDLPYYDEYPKTLLNAGSYNDTLYALPYNVDLSALLYNKDLFAEAGLDPEEPPETWQELINYGKKLTQDTDEDGAIEQWGFAVQSYTGFWYLPLLWANGGEFSNQNCEVLYNSPEAVETMEFWVDLVHEHKIAPKSSISWKSDARYNAFITEKLAMFLGGNFNITTIQKDAPNLEYGVTYLPKPKDGHFSSFAGGNVIGITSQSKNPSLAWEFIKFATSKDVMIDVMAKNRVLPGRPNLFDNKYFNKLEGMQKFASILEVADYPKCQYQSAFNSEFALYLEKALRKEISPKTAVEKTAEAMKDIVEEERG